MRSLINRLRALAKRDKLENDLDEELKFHVEMKTRENLAAGMSPDQARSAALRKFGNVARTQENTRTEWTLPRLESFLQDLRYALRQLRRNPGFTAVAVLTLALGIGANTAIFSFVSPMLLQKPPIPDPDRVMKLVSKNPAPVWGADRFPVSAPDFMDWRAQTTAFSNMAASTADEFTLSGGTQPERVAGWRVTADYFRVLGVEPALGRAFAPGEDQAGHERTVILSEGLWRRRFAADPRAIGRTVKIDGDEYTIIGIMPSRFHIGFFRVELWVPLVFTPQQMGPAGRSNHFLDVVARLKPGESEKQAEAEMATLSSRIAAAHPETSKGWGARVLTLQQYIIEEGNVKTALLFLMATVGFVLLIPCANLANLLLARNSARQREFTVRAALGARRFRLAQQLLSECALLSLSGGGLGLVFAAWGLRLLCARLNWNDYAVQMARVISIDGRVLAFTLVISLVAALVFGLAPAFQISRPDLNARLKEDSRTAAGARQSHRLQSLLVMGELALSLILLVAAGLFAKGFIEEMQASMGIDPHKVLTASVSLTGPAYLNASRQRAYFQAVLGKLKAFSQVESAAVASDLPLSFADKIQFALEGQPEDNSGNPQWYIPDYRVSPGYFETLRIPLVEGRYFRTFDDSLSAPVVIVNQAFARKYFAGQNALGHRVSIIPKGAGSRADAPQWNEIVGVVGDVEQVPGETPHAAQIYEPFQARPSAAMNFVVRTHGDPGTFADALRRAIGSVDKDQAVTALRTMDRVVQDSNQGDDLMTELMGTFAAIALVMATIGIYGLLAYLVG
jgi:putative ABC transport system permease protein